MALIRREFETMRREGHIPLTSQSLFQQNARVELGQIVAAIR
jgi:hypothetical protein